MALQTIYSNNLNPELPNLSNRFTDAVGFIIVAPLIGTGIELEINVFLQIYLPYGNGEIARNIPLGKIEEQAILLNITDTETTSIIPSEFLHCGLEMALLFLASDNTYLEAIIIKPDITLLTLNQKIEDLIMALYSELLQSLQQEVALVGLNWLLSLPPGTTQKLLNVAASRKGLTVKNLSSTAPVYLGWDAEVDSTSNFFEKIPPSYTYTFDFAYTGELWSFVPDGSGDCNIRLIEVGSNSQYNSVTISNNPSMG